MKNLDLHEDMDRLPDDAVSTLEETVIGGGYCVGCGACAALPRSPYEMRLTPMGWYEPTSRTDVSPDAALDAICPFADAAPNEDEIAKEAFGSAPHWDPRIGYYRAFYAGHVAEGTYRVNGSSGGLVTWLLEKLLAGGLIDAAIHVREGTNPEAGPLFTYQISRSVAEIRAGAKSRYYPVELSQVLNQVRRTPGTYAVVGVPCFIKAVRLLMKQDVALAERIRYSIAIFCGHMKSARFADLLAWQAGILPGHLQRIDFRKKLPDRPANRYGVEVHARGLGAGVLPMEGLLGHDWGAGLLKLKACDYCDDVGGETADVCIGDAWLPRYAKDPQGSNIVIVRTADIDRLLQDGIGSGALSLQNVSADDVAASQRASLTHRRKGLAYRLYLADREGAWRPKKRVKAQAFPFSFAFKQTQRVRLRLRETSHAAFREAIRCVDFDIFRNELDPLLAAYDASKRGMASRLRHELYWLPRIAMKGLAHVWHRGRSSALKTRALRFVARGFLIRIYQLRYWLRDYVFRRPYKVLKCTSEFGAELKWALPHAYWHYLNGTLRETRSFEGTAELYFFSPKHVETQGRRKYFQSLEIPNSEDHNFQYDLRKWTRVPLAEHFRDGLGIRFEKPLLVISNKYNREWDGPPVNFISITLLDKLCALLSERFQIVYNRPEPKLIVQDHNEILPFGDKTRLRDRWPTVILLEDLYHQHRQRFRDFNHFQMCLYAHCQRFLSVQGGNAVLASYFGGRNVILHRRGWETSFGEYENFYPKLAGTEIQVASDEDSFLRMAEEFLMPLNAQGTTTKRSS